MNGTITGGWGFVWAAYGVTATALFIYGVTLITRLRGARSGAKHEGTAP
jgi:heme exporter protein D